MGLFMNFSLFDGYLEFLVYAVLCISVYDAFAFAFGFDLVA